MVAPINNLLVQPGCASLEVQLVADASAAVSAYSSNPLKLLVPQPRGQSVWAFTSSFGGGLVAGDRTRLNLRVGDRTRCFIGSQASTKIYRNPQDRPCSHVTEADVDAGALLVFAPDPVQAFAGSSYEQRQLFRLAADANFFFVDWISAGRSGRGERWDLNRMTLRNEVRMDGELVFLDALWLDAKTGALKSQHRTGRFNCFATLLCLGPVLRRVAEAMLADVAQRSVEKQSPLLISASPLRDGVLLRIAGESVEAVGRELRRHCSGLHEHLGDDPWARKW